LLTIPRIRLKLGGGRESKDMNENGPRGKLLRRRRNAQPLKHEGVGKSWQKIKGKKDKRANGNPQENS